jgi:hypothetical protein
MEIEVAGSGFALMEVVMDGLHVQSLEDAYK